MALVNRWYQILNLLVGQPYLPLREVQKALSISQKTLLNSIEQLNDILDNDLHITKQGDQLSLQVFNYSRLEDILAGSLRKESDFNSSSKRTSYIIKRLLHATKPILIDNLAEEIGVSRTTINKDLKQVKQLANHYQITIIGKTNQGLSVRGDELQLRLFYCHNVYAYFNATTLSLETEQFLKECYQTYQLPKSVQDLLSKVIAIMIFRLQHGHLLEKSIPYFSNGLKDSEIMEQLVFHIETTYHISLSQYEQDFLAFPLNMQYIDNLPYQEVSNHLILHVFQKMISRSKDTFDFQINSEKLFVDMHMHLRFLLNRLIFHTQANDLFHGEIKEKYPLAYQLASDASTVLRDMFKYPVDSSEISYLALYFEMGLRETKTEEGFDSRKIAVVCTTGRGTATMINRQIRRIIGNEITIDQYSEENFNPLQAKKYSAIFTTIPLKFQNISPPVIQLTNLFDDQWLRTKWEEISNWEYQQFEHVQLTFMRLNTQTDYRQYLLTMANYLEEEQYVDNNFHLNILKREDKQSTIFGQGIAFPHTTHTKKQVTLLLGVLDETYRTSNKSVDLIFMLAIPEHSTPAMEKELLSLYDDIFRIANNDDIKQELKTLTSTDAFQSLIKCKGVLK
ncbi:BglG family transcription antiterminator [Streptococcus pluranimalium]|uniref:BglG family transcription antiterminator n=1 Tax=Streptococcus pluranimalium TaxID=82348 RepID=UPI0039FC0476